MGGRNLGSKAQRGSKAQSHGDPMGDTRQSAMSYELQKASRSGLLSRGNRPGWEAISEVADFREGDVVLQDVKSHDAVSCDCQDLRTDN